jgi:DNA-binding transcriptional ArsR family regulator
LADDDTEGLDRALAALANPHRRSIVHMLGLQPSTISSLAHEHGLSLPAIHKHLKVLETAGLITRRKVGRSTFLTLSPAPIRLIQVWAGQFHPHWGSDQASYENYYRHLGIESDRASESQRAREQREHP